MVDIALQKHFIAIFTVFKAGLMPYQELHVRGYFLGLIQGKLLNVTEFIVVSCPSITPWSVFTVTFKLPFS